VANRVDNRLDALATAQFVLRQRLAGIEPITDAQSGGRAIEFSGQPETVDFIGRAADRSAPDALQYYRLQRNAAGDLVLLSLSTLDPRADPFAAQSAGWTPLVLLPGIAQISIRYLGQNPMVAEQHSVWQASWSDRASLPMLIRISVGFAEGDKRHWPDLVVHPRAATPQPCARDAVTGGCAIPVNGVA
jgi:general secretion pathway protein J